MRVTSEAILSLERCSWPVAAGVDVDKGAWMPGTWNKMVEAGMEGVRR